MIFRQLFDSVSSTYTYLIASRRGGEALIIDPVIDRVDRYMALIEELEAELGRPIVACNAAVYWQALRAAGIDDRFAGYGRLLADH